MLLREMIEIYSPTGSTDILVDFLIGWAGRRGFHAHKDEVGNFIAEKGEGKTILLVGHLDTVAGEIPIRVEGKRLYGRGVVDAKGALACFLEAAHAVKRGRIVVVGTIDEEGDSKGAQNILNKYNPNFIVIGEPSGWSNLNIGYKGRINLLYTNEKSKEHTSSPNPNCIEEAMAFFNGMRKFCDSFNEGKTLFEQLGMKLLSINSEEDGFTQKTKMTMNFRIPPHFDIEKMRSHAEKCKCNASLHYSHYEEPVRAGKDNKLVKAFMKAIRLNGGKVSFKLKSGTSDMNILQKYNVPMVTYGPGDSTLDHTPFEHLDVGEYEKAVEVLKMVLEEILG